MGSIIIPKIRKRKKSASINSRNARRLFGYTMFAAVSLPERKAGKLDDYGIANRMSYFLWSSMPDKTLFALASAGKLKDSAIRKKQVERMLKDDKAQAFIRHFPSAWLRLDKLGDMPPSGGDYQFYKNLRVEPMLARQVTMYFEEILKNNGKIEEFIDSDYTFMNQTLAKWIYRREGIRGERLRKVSLNDPKRGGIFYSTRANDCNG